MGGTCRHKRPRWGEHQYCWPWLLVTGWKRWCLKPPSVCSASSMKCRDWHWYGLSSTARPCTCTMCHAGQACTMCHAGQACTMCHAGQACTMCHEHGIMQDTTAEAESGKKKCSRCKRQRHVDLSSRKQFSANGCVTFYGSSCTAVD